jgi:hypothetical protein
MRTLATFAGLLACLVSTVYATALTYRLEAHEKACFFAHVEHKGTKVAFYFAVRRQDAYVLSTERQTSPGSTIAARALG